jgi:hypothetical protein
MILGKAAIRALDSLEAAIGVKQNTAASIGTVFDAIYGRPAGRP